MTSFDGWLLAARSAVGSIAAAVLAGCAPAPASPAGDWIGDLHHPRITLPLEVTIDSSLAQATVGARVLQLAGAAGQVVARGDTLTVSVPSAAGDTVAIEGVVAMGVWRGTARRGSTSIPFELVRVLPASDSARRSIQGTWRGSDGRLFGIGMLAEFGERPTLVDYGSGRIGPLFPVDDGRFLVGRSIVAPIFPADTLELAGGELRLQLGGERLTAARLATRDLDLEFGDGPVRLAGTLTLPEGDGPYPAIVLVHGSNAQTRDAMGPWVRYFAGLGFAALAYDKRGTGRSTGDWKEADFPTLANDALAAVRALRSRTDIRSDRIGLWGISQAGWILPLVQNAAPDEIAFLIVHAGTGTTVREQGLLNYRNELRFAGLPDSLVAIGMGYRVLDDSVTRTGRGLELLERYYRTNRTRAPWLDEPAPLDAWFRRYYRMLMDYDPAESWRKMTAPVLLFFGELDANVPPAESWPPIERGLARAGNTRVAHYVLPRANHLFLEAETGGRDEYPHLVRFVGGYFDRMAAWLQPWVAR